MLEKGNVYYENLEAFSENLIGSLKLSFPKTFSKTEKTLKESILKASSQYIFDENKSLWSETWFQDAYIAYFTPTQTSRLFYTFNRIQGLIDFSRVSKIVDFGCGPASAHLAAQAVLGPEKLKAPWLNIDSEDQALEFAKKIEQQHKIKSSYLKAKDIPNPKADNEMLILSFALCEGLNIETIFKYKYILILEPGQFKNSKKLINIRAQALEKGFSALAPCVHQEKCPMTEGRKNWCHDAAPKPKSIPTYGLPFSNERLSFSYLLLSNEQQSAKALNKNKVRIIGDLRLEKGKSKLAICRSQNPVFLSWLKKSKLNLNLSRGDLIKLPKEILAKGQEVRIEDEIKADD